MIAICSYATSLYTCFMICYVETLGDFLEKTSHFLTVCHFYKRCIGATASKPYIIPFQPHKHFLIVWAYGWWTPEHLTPTTQNIILIAYYWQLFSYVIFFQLIWMQLRLMLQRPYYTKQSRMIILILLNYELK